MFNNFVARRSEHLIPRGYLWTLRKNTGDRAWPPAQTKTTNAESFHRRPVSGAAMVPAFLVTKLQKLLGSWQTQTHRPTSIRPRCAGLLVL